MCFTVNKGRRRMSKPKVVTINSASVDGRIAVSPDVLLLYGDERWNAIEAWSPVGESDSAFEWLKRVHKPQATLEGSGSLVTERTDNETKDLPPFDGDPESLLQDFLPDIVLGRPGHRGWFTAVDGRGRVRGWIKDGSAFGEDLAGTHLLVLVGRHTPPEYLAYLRREDIPYLVAGDGPVDLALALEKMQAKLGVTCVRSTAGGKLNGALLRAGLVDEVNVEFLPAIIGGPETPSLFNAPTLKLDEWPARLELMSAQVQAGGRVWLRYRVVREVGTPSPSSASPGGVQSI
jgi:2,5-diamino-6-(ribosylamino)-4(3H)-pyrimidinone 5'-phosphate reductase